MWRNSSLNHWANFISSVTKLDLHRATSEINLSSGNDVLILWLKYFIIYLISYLYIILPFWSEVRRLISIPVVKAIIFKAFTQMVHFTLNFILASTVLFSNYISGGGFTLISVWAELFTVRILLHLNYKFGMLLHLQLIWVIVMGLPNSPCSLRWGFIN